MTYEDEEIPRSLLAQYNKLCSAGLYNNTLSRFIELEYLIFKTLCKGNIPSKKAWLEGLLEKERK